MNKTAFLVMDVQGGIVPRLKLPESFLPTLSKTINASRPHVAKIIYAAVAFRPGHPEINLETSPASFVAAKKGNAFLSGSPDAMVHPSVAPQEDVDIFVEKKRVSAFAGSGLDFILRGLGVDTLVLTGLSTGGVVLSTVCDAADRDFKIVVLKDLCCDPDETLHEILMAKIFSKRGEVITAEEWLGRLPA